MHWGSCVKGMYPLYIATFACDVPQLHVQVTGKERPDECLFVRRSKTSHMELLSHVSLSGLGVKQRQREKK